MGLLPENHAARIAWFQSRTALWTTNATAIGTTTAAVSDVSTKVTAAAAAMAALTNSGMVVVEQVRTKSRTAGDGVFPLSNIPAPATPSSIGAPGEPTS